MFNLYCDVRTIRLRYGFHNEETLGDRTGSTIKLTDRAYNIIEFQKNAVLLTDPADYSLIPQITLSLTTPAVDTDLFYIVYGTKLPDETLLEALKAATAKIDNFLDRSYGVEEIARWKQFQLEHGTVTSGPFVVDEVVTGSVSGATGKVAVVAVDHIMILPITDAKFATTDTISGGASGASAPVAFSPGVTEPIPQAPSLISEIAKELTNCYGWEFFRSKNHGFNPQFMERNYEKKMSYYDMLDGIDKGKISLSGSVSLGTTDRPSIGRPMHKRLFKTNVDLEDTNYTDNFHFPEADPVSNEDDNLGHVQLVLNKLREIIRSDASFDGIAIHIIPRYDPDTMNPPFMHMYATDTEYNDLGYQKKQAYILSITIKLIIPQHEVDSDSRKIHSWESMLEELILANRQAAIPGLRIQQYRIRRASYIDLPEGIDMSDSVEFNITCDYDRTVNV